MDCKGTDLVLGSLFCSIDLCVFLCQYQTGLIIMALYYTFISGSVIPPALFLNKLEINSSSVEKKALVS